jgi:hypothetical protein
MRWACGLVLSAVVCAICVGCAADGGPGGTGISPAAVISGNVVDVQTTPSSAAIRSAAVALPRIQVSLDGLPNIATTADSDGNFLLRGNFAGSVAVRFTVPEFQVTQALDVPAGSTIVLQDIELRPDGVVAQAARQLRFFGTVDLVDCADGTLLLRGRKPGDGQFLVHLGDQTSFVDPAGDAQNCTDIRVGRAVVVEGTIAYAADRTITALVVTIAALPPPPPEEEVELRFGGAIAAVDCSVGVVVVDDSVQRTAVRLTPQTRFSGMGAVTCGDLHLGDTVRGEGQLDLRAPGMVVATHLTITGPASAEQPLRFVGLVTTIDCSRGLLQIGDDETTIDVRISPATLITRRNGQPLTCDDIQVGDRAEGRGRLAASPGVLDAAEITVTHRGPVR